MKLKDKHLYTIVSLPLIVGGIIYLLFRSKTLLMFTWLKYISLYDFVIQLRDSNFVKGRYIVDWAKYSLPDGLWIFSATSILMILWKGKITGLSILWILILPSVAVFSELGQLFKLIPGVFDVIDLLSYLFSTTLAIVIFRAYYFKLKSQ